MQVNSIQSNNYNASFGRAGSRWHTSAASDIKGAVDSYCSSSKGTNDAKKLLNDVIDKCEASELREIAEKIQKKLRPANVDNGWF